MIRFVRWFATLLKYGTFLATLGFVGCILLQIFARLLLPSAPNWTEEAARLFFVLAIGCAAGLALRGNEYVHFDFLARRLPSVWQRRLGVAIDLLTVVLFAVFTVFALRFVLMGWAERSPTLRFPMAVPFAGVLVLGGSLTVFAVQRLWSGLTSATPTPPLNRNS